MESRPHNVHLLTVRGVPVHVHRGMLALAGVAAIAGWIAPWVAIAFTAYLVVIIAHELGHLFAGRAVGAKVHCMDIEWFGGSVSMDLPERPWHVIAVFAAGM